MARGEKKNYKPIKHCGINRIFMILVYGLQMLIWMNKLHMHRFPNRPMEIIYGQETYITILLGLCDKAT